jgi:flagellar basal-body rod modification protein FlgD
MFLRLLIAQLEHQDPLSPMENADFTAQLAQFSTLEQVEAMNANLHTLVQSQATVNASQAKTQALSLLGREVEMRGNTMQVQQGVASPLAYTLPAHSTEVLINILDQDGHLLQSLRKLDQRAGRYEVPRPGGPGGTIRLPNGSYKVEVAASDHAGQPVAVETWIQGRVEGVEYVDDSPYLLIGGNRVPYSDMARIREKKA